MERLRGQVGDQAASMDELFLSSRALSFFFFLSSFFPFFSSSFFGLDVVWHVILNQWHPKQPPPQEQPASSIVNSGTGVTVQMYRQAPRLFCMVSFQADPPLPSKHVCAASGANLPELSVLYLRIVYVRGRAVLPSPSTQRSPGLARASTST